MQKFVVILFGVVALALFMLGGGGATTPSAAAAVSPVAVAAAAQACNDGQDRSVTIINETGVTMLAFFASPPDVNDWEDDILGDEVIQSDSSFVVNFDDGRCRCIYDFRAVFANDFADDDVVIRNKINVCEISTYRYD
jgi:hypothetical protein